MIQFPRPCRRVARRNPPLVISACRMVRANRRPFWWVLPMKYRRSRNGQFAGVLTFGLPLPPVAGERITWGPLLPPCTVRVREVFGALSAPGRAVRPPSMHTDAPGYCCMGYQSSGAAFTSCDVRGRFLARPMGGMSKGRSGTRERQSGAWPLCCHWGTSVPQLRECTCGRRLARGGALGWRPSRYPGLGSPPSARAENWPPAATGELVTAVIS